MFSEAKKALKDLGSNPKIDDESILDHLKDAVFKPKIIATHKVEKDDTLSSIAAKYYGHATPKYWQLIYKANEAAIGDNPNKVKRGLELKIPELPDDLK